MSEDERLQILQMVQDGVITVDEAQALLEALEPSAGTETAAPAAAATTDTPGTPDTATTFDITAPRKKKKRDDMPDMRRFRHYWEYPFIIGLILLGVAGLCASNTPYPLMMICGWSVFAVAGLVEPPCPRANDEQHGQRGNAACYVHNGGPGEIDKAHGFEPAGRGPAGKRAAPGPMADDGIEQSCQRDGDDQIGCELHPLGNSA